MYFFYNTISGLENSAIMCREPQKLQYLLQPSIIDTKAVQEFFQV